MDFLLGRNQQEETEDMPSIIVGDGRVGAMLADFGKRRGFDDVIIKRGDPIPELTVGEPPCPIYICTRAEDLEAVVAQCPKDRWDDLVFLQNGQLEPFRQKYALYDTTQAVLWFAAMRKGGKPMDGIISGEPDGLTTVSGKWAGSFAMRLNTGKLTCKVTNDRDLRRNMLEKLVWISAFMLVGTANGGITVGEVVEKHRPEVEALIRELASFCRFTLSVALKTGLEDRLCDYAERVEFFPTALKEFEFRNGYFYRYSLMAGKRTAPNGMVIEMPDSTPLHTEYLMLARDKGLISQGDLDSVAPSPKVGP